MAIFSTFGKHKPRTPQELVTKTQATLEHLTLTLSDKDAEKFGKEATLYLAALKCNVLGSDGKDADGDVLTETVTLLLESTVIPLMIDRLSQLDFETRKDVATLFTAICKFKLSSDGSRGSIRDGDSSYHPTLAASAGRASYATQASTTFGRASSSNGRATNSSQHGAATDPTASNTAPATDASSVAGAAGSLADAGARSSGATAVGGGEEGEQAVYPGLLYLRAHWEVVEQLFAAYQVSAVALNCGSMLRDCLRDREVTRRFISTDAHMLAFFDKVQVSSFEVASDAFTTFKRMMQDHPDVVAKYLDANYDMFWTQYNTLLQSENYVTRRQSLKLLGELLMHRSNVTIMVRYVSDIRNLMLVMNLLKDSSRTIQFEAFHVFKVFVANPWKPLPVKDILLSNQEKLLRYLAQFLPEREDQDEDFASEKADIIREIQEMAVSESGEAGDSSGPVQRRVTTGDMVNSISFSNMHLREEGYVTEELSRDG